MSTNDYLHYICPMASAKNDIHRWLKTVKNYAVNEGVTASYIYKLVKEQKMELVVIDDVRFVDTKQYPTLPVINRRK